MMSNNINMNNMVALLRSRLAIGALLTANITCPKSTNSDGDINDNHNKLLLLLLHDYHLNICCCALHCDFVARPAYGARAARDSGHHATRADRSRETRHAHASMRSLHPCSHVLCAPHSPPSAY